VKKSGEGKKKAAESSGKKRRSRPRGIFPVAGKHRWIFPLSEGGRSFILFLRTIDADSLLPLIEKGIL
jgi:hypothetical protein